MIISQSVYNSPDGRTRRWQGSIGYTIGPTGESMTASFHFHHEPRPTWISSSIEYSRQQKQVFSEQARKQAPRRYHGGVPINRSSLNNEENYCDGFGGYPTTTRINHLHHTPSRKLERKQEQLSGMPKVNRGRPVVTRISPTSSTTELWQSANALCGKLRHSGNGWAWQVPILA